MRISIRTKQHLITVLIPVIIAVMLVVIIRFTWIFVQYLQKNSSEKVNIVVLWNNGDYPRVLTLSENTLQKNPMDDVSLVFAGFASYYMAVYSSEIEERFGYLERAVFYLRRYLNTGGKKYRAEANYILAKAYYSKGAAYANLVIEYLDKATALGYANNDMNEYYGLAYSQLGNDSKGIEYLLKMQDGQRNSAFYFNLAESYAAAGRAAQSERYYKKVIEEGRDDNLRDKSRFRLAVLYLNLKRYDEAQALLEEFLAKYPNSADAYHYIGDVYAATKDDRRARQAWQQAVRLDHSKQDVLARLLQ
jgi:tetratricopeptide (TPR) repeat protein